MWNLLSVMRCYSVLSISELPMVLLDASWQIGGLVHFLLSDGLESLLMSWTCPILYQQDCIMSFMSPSSSRTCETTMAFRAKVYRY